MLNTAQFRITYEGDALIQHEMDVKDLAPALLAMGELLEESNLILNGNKTKVLINVKGSPIAGSFSIDFAIIQDLFTKTLSFFKDSEKVNEVNTILTFLGIAGIIPVGKGLIGFIKWLRNRKIKNILKLQTGNLKLTLEDGDTIETREEVIKLYQDTKVRTSLSLIIKQPLDKRGVESVVFKHQSNEERVVKAEADLYNTPEVVMELIGEDNIQTNLQMVSVSFQEGNKWRFTDGNVSFFADILDQDFINKVQQSEEFFSKNDILKVTLHKRQYLTMEGIKTDYSIIKVISHRSAAVQIQLPFLDQNKPNNTRD